MSDLVNRWDKRDNVVYVYDIGNKYTLNNTIHSCKMSENSVNLLLLYKTYFIKSFNIAVQKKKIIP